MTGWSKAAQQTQQTQKIKIIINKQTITTNTITGWSKAAQQTQQT